MPIKTANAETQKVTITLPKLILQRMDERFRPASAAASSRKPWPSGWRWKNNS
ncbi:MAG: hypothetical protein HZY76_19805 [Anaerolineae bacterium]|nr:MAG: hypothetical protein HZY76_19805 [Anaerolineae bacterium]